MKRKTLILFLTALVIMGGCSPVNAASAEGTVSSNPAIQSNQELDLAESNVTVSYDQNDLVSSENNTEMSMIQLQGNSISFEGSGALVEGSLVTITDAGTYHVSGSLIDGQIIVDAADDDQISIVLDGVDIQSLDSSPIYIKNADKVVISLASGSDNVVSDGESYILEDAGSDEPNAAIFSHDDLTINGSGSLTVNANYNNGITSKDDLKITGGEITINAVNDGLKGRDSVAIQDGEITINADGDGIQSNNDQDPEVGFVSIEGGSLLIVAGLDGIQAETSLSVSGGDISVFSGGGSKGSAADSAKGLKAGVNLWITGGNIRVDAADDALHSNGNLTVDSGEIELASGDDAVHGEEMVIINNGNLKITASYEGIEGAVIIINGGNINLVSRDDGINVSTGGGMGDRFVSSDNYLEINGGYLVVNAGGDGLDSNGYGTMNDGLVIVYGPTNNGNGSLDVMGQLVINGGFLAATGSAGMAQSPSTTSTQYSVLQVLPSTQTGGTLIHIVSDAGIEILTLEPPKEFQTIVISSPELELGSSYSVYVGGSATGTAVDGLYSAGAYSPGNLLSSFTISGMVTGESAGMMGGGGNPGPMDGGGRGHGGRGN